MTVRNLAALAAFVLVSGLSPVQAGENLLSVAGANVTMPVTSLREARFKTVVRQEYDFSCGSAALATLLTYHYNRPTTEEEAFQAMFANGDQALIEKNGFSLADMQRYLASMGIQGDGYRIGLDKLLELGVPAITLINTKGYSHFVVVKGVKDGQVLLGDPAWGLRALPRKEFATMWRGVMFVIRDDMELARQSFNGTEDWTAHRTSPLGTALSRQGLSTFSVALPGLFEF